MAKFRPNGLGRGAEHPVTFPAFDESGEVYEHKTLATPIDGSAESVALAFASSYAISRGASEALAKEGNPLWDLGYMAKVVQLACFDPESPEKMREKTFATVEDVLSLGRETIAFIFESQQHWQDQISPTRKRMTDSELFIEMRRQAEADDPGPFLRLAPGLRWTLHRFMARLLLSFLEEKSQGTSSSENAGQTSSKTLSSESESLKNSEQRRSD